ncbi:tRNA uridine 5-oxyacetic acid(34) methyltransferase CmoM [Salinivibrio kushneri]|nr:tRNA uridine 5-oxyacetic acid(34) methyltransferase CmoM [Salinivibrio kushneri]
MITNAIVTEDKNFDDIAHKFVKNIYGSGKGEIRQAVVWQDIEQILHCFPPEQTLHILDAGGGVAPMSRHLAARGHRVTLCDLSSQMLDLARQEIEQQGLLAQYQLIHSSAQTIGEYLSEPPDVILFHAVLEWTAEPEQVLKNLLKHLRPGGMASVMFYNQTGLLFKNLVCGNLTHVEEGMPHRKRFKLQPPKGLHPESVYQWMQDSDITLKGKTGVRTFHDYMRDTNIGDFTFEQVIALEQQLCRQEPFVSLGRYIHVWGQHHAPSNQDENKDNG